MEARLHECLLLSTAGHLWSVANAASSIAVLPASDGDEAAPPAGTSDRDVKSTGWVALPAHKQRVLWDLRCPLGVPPAARARERELRLSTQQGLGRMEAVEQQEVPLSKLLQDRCVLSVGGCL